MKFIVLLAIIAIIVVAARMLMAGQRPESSSAAESPRQSAPPAPSGVKADEASRTYHTSESPDFDHLPGEVWFESEEAAKVAGFTRWDQMR